MYLCLIVSATSCGSITENQCMGTAGDFAHKFNQQDYRGTVRLFQTNELDGSQYKRLENNFKYIYRVAGAINAIDFIKQDGNKLVYLSTHERTAMDITFKVNEKCQLISYVIQTHYPDSLPLLERNVTRMALPFTGEWQVDWGGTTTEQNYHNRYRNMKGAFDFSKIDSLGKPYMNLGKENKDYHAFGEAVLAPCQATVVKVVDGIKDNPIGITNDAQTYGNSVVIRTGNLEYLLFAHLKYQSILVEEGATGESGRRDRAVWEFRVFLEAAFAFYCTKCSRSLPPYGGSMLLRLISWLMEF